MSDERWVSIELPSQWVKTQFRDFCDVVRGGSPRPMGDPRYFGGPIPFVKISDVTASDGRVLKETSASVTIEGSKRSRLLPKGTLILSNSGTICVPVFLGVDACIHDGFVTFDDLPSEISGEFLFHFFNYVRPFLRDKHKQGVTQVNLNTGIVGEIPFPLPPLAEQRRIVAKIEELFSELDAGEESLRRARRQLGVYRQSLLKQAFEGKLTSARMADSAVPQKWHTMTIREACENIKVGIVIQPKQYYSKDEDGIKAFRSANVREFRIEDSNWVYFSKSGNDANARTRLKTDDLLIVRSGYPGTSCVVTPAFEGCNAIDILVATPNQKVLRSDFLCAFNNSPLAKGLFNTGSRGVAQKHLNVGVYSALTISVPSLAEQQEIVRLLDEQFTVIEQNEREIDAALKRSSALRQSILKKAFTGQLVPQDPTDEPASALLERIRQEGSEASSKTKKTSRKRES